MESSSCLRSSLVGSIVAAVAVLTAVVEFSPHLAWLIISIHEGGIALTCVGVAKWATAVAGTNRVFEWELTMSELRS